MPNFDPPPAIHSMRVLSFRILLFCVPFLLAWGALEWWAARMPTSHAIKRENLRRLETEIDTLILGSSSAYWDIAPRLLPGTAFNLANVAQSYYYDDQLLTKELPDLPKLRRVILTVPYLSLFFQLHGSDEDERQYYYYQEWGSPPPRLREQLDLRMWSRTALKTPQTTFESFVNALRNRTGIKLSPAPLDPPVDERGWCPREAGDPKDLELRVVQAKLKYHHGLMHLSDEAANRSYLAHIAALLSQRHIELILVTPPVWPSYSNGFDPVYWNRTQSAMAELSRIPNVRYLSFLNAGEFREQDFLDADHLNKTGAARFTLRLQAAIESKTEITR